MNGVNEQDGGNCGKMRVVKRELFERREGCVQIESAGGEGRDSWKSNRSACEAINQLYNGIEKCE